MNQETLQALKKSIGKWESIAAGIGIDGGAENCALCRLFRRGYLHCGDCLVRKRTGGSECLGSPYWDFVRHINAEHPGANHRFCLCPECRMLAQAEVVFLKSLLPEESV